MPTEKYFTQFSNMLSPKLKMYHVEVPYKDKTLLREHHHTEIEIGLYNCHGEYMIDKTIYTFHPGDIFIFRSNLEHRILKLNNNSDLRVLNLFIEPNYVWSPENTLFNSKYIQIIADNLFSCYLVANDELTNLVTRLLYQIYDEFQLTLPDYESAINLHMLNILIDITRPYHQIISVHNSDSEKLLCLEHAITYITKNLTEPLTLDDIATHACLSKNYFSSLFKKMNGMSIWDFITIKRVEVGMKLLTSTNKSITEISALCGYNSTTNFNHAFKKITNISPSTYRDIHIS